VRSAALLTRAPRWIAETSYLHRWIVLEIAIEAIAGASVIVFYRARLLSTHLLLAGLAGYTVPTPTAGATRSAL
jgi:CIC family chloride channel protein